MLWRLLTWGLLALVQRRVALAGDGDRRRAEATLREGYAGGYLTLDEFSQRTGRALSARSRRQLGRALFGLPRSVAVDVAQTTVRDIVAVVVTGAYIVFTLALALVLGLALLFGASTSTAVVFTLVWLVPTVLFARFRRR
jgi:DUF1707 SHOCT-like domain